MSRWYSNKLGQVIGFVALLLMTIANVNAANQTVIIAIDAGHGGKDPGALGQMKLQEKAVNHAVAQKLYKFLAQDPMFQPVLTRNGDYFISVAGRSDIARTKNAHFLVSIHADAAKNNKARGASVWVLSNKRANNETGRWLEQQEKQSELLGGGGDALSHSEDNRYLSQAVLDLQFANSQRVGYDVATILLSELNKVGKLHKSEPEHASLGILRSPDIPSVLVEVGFISNAAEEQLLRSAGYQSKLAKAIYLGLRRYFIANPVQSAVKKETVKTATATMASGNNSSKTKNTTNSQDASATTLSHVHVVVAGQTLYSIAKSYKSNVATFKAYNNLSKDTVYIGQRLNVPVNSASRAIKQPDPVIVNQATANKPMQPKQSVTYKVVAGDSLSVIAQKHNVSANALKRANNMNSNQVNIGQSLIIP